MNVPHVTDILASAGMVGYGAVREEVLARKAALGKAVHRAIEFYNQDVIEGLDMDRFEERVDIDPQASGYLKAWKRFCSESRFRPTAIETRWETSVAGLAFVMTPDCVGQMGVREAIVDAKTTAATQPWHGVQFAAYSMGYGKPPDDPTWLAWFSRRDRFSVQLQENGTYRLKTFEDPTDAYVFLAALQVAWWKIGRGMGNGREER